jgi:5'-nucleotidase
MARRLRALVTNDDGIDADGIRALATAARDHGLDVVVAAPLTESSGSGASMIATQERGRIVVERRELPGLAGIPAYGVAAYPAFIVMIATRGGFGAPPDLVLSGVNRGANTGHALIHSGTAGAVMTGPLNGCRGMAISLAVADLGPDGEPMPEVTPHWETATQVVGELLPLITQAGDETVLNVNVPDLPVEELAGFRQATLTAFGTVRVTVAEVGEGFLQTAIEEIKSDVDPETDLALIHKGYVTVTALRPYLESIDTPLPGLAGIRLGSE